MATPRYEHQGAYGPAGTYRFWLTWNGEEGRAESHKFTRDVYCSSIASMLTSYADRHPPDITDHPDEDHRIAVRSPDGTLRTWTIRGETTVRYTATPAPVAR